MSARICTKCGKTLTSTHSYFCGYCGDMLSPSLINKPSISNINIVNYEILNVSKGVKLWYSLLNSRFFVPLVFLIAVISVIMLFVGIDNKNKIQSVLRPKITEEKKECLGEFICGDFGSDKITSVVPESAVFYAEGFDFKKFSQFILDYDNSYTSLVYELSSLESQHIALFVESLGNQNYWTFVLVSSKEPSSNLIKLINNSEKIYIGRLDNFYIVSSRRDILGDMQKSKDGISKNIGQNSTYSVATSNNKKGQILILFKKDFSETIKKLLSNDKVSKFIKTTLSEIDLEKESYKVI